MTLPARAIARLAWSAFGAVVAALCRTAPYVGAGLAVTLALAVLAWHRAGYEPVPVVTIRGYGPAHARDRAAWAARGAEGWPSHRPTICGDYRSFGVRYHAIGIAAACGCGPCQWELWRVECGWPVPCFELEASKWSGCSTRTNVQHRGWEVAGKAVPGRVIWPGLAGNVLLVAAVLGSVRLGGVGARRVARSARGRCPRCGYPVGAARVCTECGGRLRRPRAARG